MKGIISNIVAVSLLFKPCVPFDSQLKVSKISFDLHAKVNGIETLLSKVSGTQRTFSSNFAERDVHSGPGCDTRQVNLGPAAKQKLSGFDRAFQRLNAMNALSSSSTSPADKFKIATQIEVDGSYSPIAFDIAAASLYRDWDLAELLDNPERTSNHPRDDDKFSEELQ